jgi:hypothetical protein
MKWGYDYSKFNITDILKIIISDSDGNVIYTHSNEDKITVSSQADIDELLGGEVSG